MREYNEDLEKSLFFCIEADEIEVLLDRIQVRKKEYCRKD